jgi:hypothetical protein
VLLTRKTSLSARSSQRTGLLKVPVGVDAGAVVVEMVVVDTAQVPGTHWE